MNSIKLGIYNVGGILVAVVLASIWALIMMLSAIVNIVVTLCHCVITLHQYAIKRGCK